jgi:hypothetical protein
MVTREFLVSWANWKPKFSALEVQETSEYSCKWMNLFSEHMGFTKYWALLLFIFTSEVEREARRHRWRAIISCLVRAKPNKKLYQSIRGITHALLLQPSGAIAL